MANAYKNKVVYNGNTLIDLSDTTAVAADVNSGKYVYLADGSRVQGSQTVHTVSETLTHITSTNQATKVISGESFHAVLTPDSGYRIESITVTMGGVDITSQVFSGGTGSKVISTNGTYDASDDGLGGYSSVTVNVSGGSSPTLQSKTATFTPTTSQQTQTVTADSGYDGLSSVGITVDAIPSQYVVPSGSQTYTANGTYDVSELAEAVVNVSGGGSSVKTGTITPTAASTTLTFDTGLSAVTGILIMPINTPLTGSRTQAAMICLSSGSFYKAISIHTNSSGAGWVSPSVYTSSRFTQSGTNVTVTGAYSFRPATGYAWFAW